ncbi:16S rRNA (guanine(966)-N(2))-methyltransferase RsmD [Roseitranquillus sediminis]|uniref:16S rRNA (guanine(966)-N(2))-methyltransferase RsmD n=1 Tax=Roseitranquillus sediminis TaxID=2809051 RepID=UPI001D0C0BCB|nr:16S rRNA (guanine(966)-N(2))-methyltransferase RsmD [Roseitranquillus sediminis]MBM9593199.1 16S rRNA (guanine(966)-N(2))-methyltransferase RsmD [Roseitranquillus sediminis]
MRIVGGRWRGTALTPLGRGDDKARLRPTADRVRESLFNMLASRGNPVTDARVLDLFAGTGALGLEALSRGASHAVFVDDGRKAQNLIRANIARLRADAAARVLSTDATRLPPTVDAPCDLVFLDPPYGRGMGARALQSALDGGWIAAEALMVWEEREEQAPPPGFVLVTARRWGDTTVTMLARA